MTGGSSGIGLWVAIYAARMGADVTIVARKVKLLGKLDPHPVPSVSYQSVYIQFIEKAVAVIKENARADQKIEYRSLDLAGGVEAIEKTFSEIEQKSGDIYMLGKNEKYF